MGEQTGIQWTDHTFNPWIGCTQISAACDSCYAKALVEGRMGGDFAERRRTSAANWKLPRRWHRKALADGVRRRVFAPSLGDPWDKQVPIEWLVDLLDEIRETPGLDWMLLTKRPMNILNQLRRAFDAAVAAERSALLAWLYSWIHKRQPPPNVWLGVTVENQAMANLRLRYLLDVPAVIRFVSAEPLLGEVNLRAIPRPYDGHRATFDALEGKWMRIGDVDPGYVRERIRLVIDGGETGSTGRPTHTKWFRRLRDDCRDTDTAYFHKQNGEWVLHKPHPGGDLGGDVRSGRVTIVHPSGRSCSDVLNETGRSTEPGSIYMARVGKARAGRLLDGVEHNGMPEVCL